MRVLKPSILGSKTFKPNALTITFAIPLRFPSQEHLRPGSANRIGARFDRCYNAR